MAFHNFEPPLLSENVYSRLYDLHFLTREFGYFSPFRNGRYLDSPNQISSLFEFYRKPWNTFQRRRIQHERLDFDGEEIFLEDEKDDFYDAFFDKQIENKEENKHEDHKEENNNFEFMDGPEDNLVNRFAENIFEKISAWEEKTKRGKIMKEKKMRNNIVEILRDIILNELRYKSFFQSQQTTKSTFNRQEDGRFIVAEEAEKILSNNQKDVERQQDISAKKTLLEKYVEKDEENREHIILISRDERKESEDRRRIERTKRLMALLKILESFSYGLVMSLSICYDVTMQSSILVFSFFLGVFMIFCAAFFKGMSSGNEAIPFSCDKEVEFVENMKIKKEEKALVLDKKSVCPNVNISDEKLETYEEENYDFWWDTIKLDLSFEQKMEMNHQMIDSGVFDMDFQKAAVEAPSMTLERKGSDVTILCFEENIHIALKAADVIFERHQLECDLIKFSKMDSQGMELILQSLQKTKHLVVIEDEWSNTGNEVFMAIRDCEGYSFYCERKTGYGRIIKVKE